VENITADERGWTQSSSRTGVLAGRSASRTGHMEDRCWRMVASDRASENRLSQGSCHPIITMKDCCFKLTLTLAEVVRTNDMLSARVWAIFEL
jgi:hypothetical protein